MNLCAVNIGFTENILQGAQNAGINIFRGGVLNTRDDVPVFIYDNRIGIGAANVNSYFVHDAISFPDNRSSRGI